MSDIVITVAHNEARLGGTLAFLNTGAGQAGFWLFANTRPPLVTDVPGADPLVTMLLADPAGAVAANELTLAAGEDALIMTSGVAVWARAFNGNGDTVFDCDVSDPEGVATVKIPSTTLFAGGVTRLVSAVLG